MIHPQQRALESQLLFGLDLLGTKGLFKIYLLPNLNVKLNLLIVKNLLLNWFLEQWSALKKRETY